MPLAQADAPCPHCIGRGRSPLERIARLGTFDEPIKSLVHQFKYHRQWVLGEMLADRLAELTDAAGLLAGGDVLVPVPLHYVRQLSRGYNQAEVLARRLARRCGKPVAQVVRRVRNTETQTHLHSRARRIANLRDAFALTDPDRIRGKNLIIVDDVLTTGATVQSIARTLIPAGPASINAIVLAIADPKHRDFQAR